VGDDKERRQKGFLPDFREAIKAVDPQWKLGLPSPRIKGPFRKIRHDLRA
jgi:hypothetical protein